MRSILYILSVVTCCFSNRAFAQPNTWYTFPSGVPEQANRYIYIDSNNVPWIGGYNGGLHKYKNGAWTHYTTSNSAISDNDVRQSCFDGLGNLWSATWKKLSKFDTTNNTWTSFNVTGQPDDILYSVVTDDQNRVWVGTDGGAAADDGLYMYDGSTWTFYNPTNSPLTGRWILQLKKDRTGKIWGCNYNSLFGISGTTITAHSLQSAGFPLNSSSTCIDFDSFNNKWVGVYGGGIGKFDGSNWTIYTPANSPLPENKIWSIAVDQDNVVWIGTETMGLVKFDGTNWTTYNTTNSAITSNRIDALAVDQLNNIWIACSYGGILVHNPSGVSGISGYVYYDKNNNNVKDALEPFLPNQVIKVDAGIFTGITNSSGEYHCTILTSGNHNAILVQNSPYITAVTPANFNFNITPAVTNLYSQNFAVQMQSGMHDVSVDYTAMNAPRPGFSYSTNLTVTNIGSVVSDDITVKLKYDPLLVFDSTSFTPLLHQGDSLVWMLNSLTVLQDTNIRVYFHLLPNVSNLGVQLTSVASAYGIIADNDSTNNTTVGHDIVIGSFDPNDKLVNPAGAGVTGDIPPTTDSLIYTVRFQNTGTASAVNVVIKDTLDTNLDLSSISMISASHNYSASIKNGVITWTFGNINLPDSNTNNAASHGYIKYRVNLKPNLPIGTELKNTAYIFFDFNPPVVTNQVLNTIRQIVIPVTLSGFNARCTGSSVNLQWSTQVEINTELFRIESSDDGINWETIGNTPAKGEYSTYRFTDNSMKNAIYRLAIVDKDGRITYSDAVLTRCSGENTLTAFPVPAKNSITIKVFAETDGMRSFDIIDLGGKLLKQEQRILHKGFNNLGIDVSALPAGNYYLRMVYDNEVAAIQKLIIIK